MRMPLTGDPRYFKAILDDYTADLIGSSLIELKNK